jgi:olfactory receptor
MVGRRQTISFASCLLQMYLVFSLGFTDYFLLSDMAYDCYLAMFYPLYYQAIMSSLLQCSWPRALGSVLS